jgi:hypothetical protein
MSKAYSEDRFPAPRLPRRLKKSARKIPDEKAPIMTEEVFFEEPRERSPSWGIHQQDEQN